MAIDGPKKQPISVIDLRHDLNLVSQINCVEGLYNLTFV